MANKRLSLYGVNPKEAIRAALNTPPPKLKKKAAAKPKPKRGSNGR